MAYIDTLPEEKQLKIHQALLVKINEEHESAYQSRLAKAKSARAKKQCAGCCEGAWWRLLLSWLDKKATNLEVMDALNAGFVIGDTEGVKFTPSRSVKVTKNSLLQ